MVAGTSPPTLLPTPPLPSVCAREMLNERGSKAWLATQKRTSKATAVPGQQRLLSTRARMAG